MPRPPACTAATDSVEGASPPQRYVLHEYRAIVPARTSTIVRDDAEAQKHTEEEESGRAVVAPDRPILTLKRTRVAATINPFWEVSLPGDYTLVYLPILWSIEHRIHEEIFLHLSTSSATIYVWAEVMKLAAKEY